MSEDYCNPDDDFKREVLNIIACSEWLIYIWNDLTEIERLDFLDELALAAANCY